MEYSETTSVNPDIPIGDGFPTITPSVTHEMVRARTVELAIRAGRRSIEIRHSDYEQAKRELTGETGFDRQQVVLYSAC